MNAPRTAVLLFVIADLAAAVVLAKAQSLDYSGLSSSTVTPTVSTAQPQPNLTDIRPTQKTKLHNYVFDEFGSYPIGGAAFAAGINQVQNTLPEWKQGAQCYTKRSSSDFGIAAVTATTRSAFARAITEDTMCYRCECKGVFPRLSHAMISTFTTRRGDDGHRVFCPPDLVATYAGTMPAIDAWYPGRHDAEDALRMGKYSLLGYVGGNIAPEFLHSGPYSRVSRMHLNNVHGAPDPGSNP